MRIVKPRTVRDFALLHRDSADQLLAWLRIAGTADWVSFADVRRTYPHADGVRVASGNVVTVFNIKGNKYRLIVSIKYQWRMIYVLRFLTHAEYSKEKWKDEL